MEETKASDRESREQLKASPKYLAKFLGSVSMDRLYPQSMQPWAMAEVHRRKESFQEVFIEVIGEALRVSLRSVSLEEKSLLFEHHLKGVTRFAKLHQDPNCFAYLTRYQPNADFQCHVFLVDHSEVIPQLFMAIREASRGMTNKPASGETTGQSADDHSNTVSDSGDTDLSKSLFEVEFVGRSKVEGRRVTSDYIDSLAEKMMATGSELMMMKMMKQVEERREDEQVEDWRKRQRHASEASIKSLPDTLEDVAGNLLTENKLSSQQQMLQQAELKSSECSTGVLLDTRTRQDTGTDAGPSTNISNDAGTDGEPSTNKSNDAGTDGSLGKVTTGWSDSLQRGVAGSAEQVEHPVVLNMDCQLNSDSGKDNLDASVEPEMSNHNLGQGQSQQRVMPSVSASGVSRRRHSSLREDGSRSQQKASFQGYSGSRQRLDSGDSLDGCRKQEGSKVMVLQVGQQEITLISLDKKVAILECKFKDISFLSQGNHRQDFFGIVVREVGTAFTCHIFRCLTHTVVAEIMSTLQVAFTTAYNRGASPGVAVTQHQVCTACPMHQLHRVCQEINNLTSQAAYDLLVERVQHLPEAELCEINSRLQAASPDSFEESVEVMMIYLRQLSEKKQRHHVHSSETNRSSKSDLNLTEEKHNLLEGLKNKAKRSLTTSFENLLHRGKRRGSLQDELKARSWTTDSETSWTSRDSSATTTPDASPVTSPMSRDFHHDFPSPLPSPHPLRHRSATIDSVESSSHSDLQIPRIRDVNHNKTAIPGKPLLLPATATALQASESVPSPSSTPPVEGTNIHPSLRRSSRSWRKVIFNRACTPQHSSDYDEDCGSQGKTHNTAEVRALWKKAFLESLLLIRLEKENHNIRARQEDGGATPSRKLEYQELTPCLKEITAVWEKILSLHDMEDGDDEKEKEEEDDERTIPHKKLQEYVKKGVPQNLRGQIWLYLMHQQQMSGAMPNSTCQGSASYEDLLKQLTTHQHAILIDLGRTFPNHPYFSRSLGPGQLELFNLLKAYSLVDPEVGYCQGLSFIVGMLLMHMEEVSAFHLLKYMMYDLGLRRQFRPNMVALQIKLYQLTRLLHDNYKDLYSHFEAHDISPTLYAAPWFLTLFASQFPLGFVARVFDMIFLQGISVLFKVALMLLGNHRALILQCDTFESIVDFLKITLPEMVQVQMERIINQAFELDIERELQAYEVEYHVLSEETDHFSDLGHRHKDQADTTSETLPSSGVGHAATRQPWKASRRSSVDLEMLYRLEHQNQALKKQNLELLEKLKITQSEREGLEVSILAHQDEQDKLKSHIKVLELERSALLTAVAKMRKYVPDQAVQHLSLPLPPALPSHPSQASGESGLLVQDLGQSELQMRQTSPDVDSALMVGICGQFKESTQAEFSSNTQPPAHPLPSADIVTANPSAHEGGAPRVLQTVAVSPVSGCQQNEDRLDCTSLPVTGVTQKSQEYLSLVLSSSSSGASAGTGDLNEQSNKIPPSEPQKALPSEAQKGLPSEAQKGLPSQLSTTFSTNTHTFSSRSISNIPSKFPAGGSLTPEERRKSVKVVVQHSSTTANQTQRMPSSER